MREQVLLAERIGVARATEMPWAEIASREDMSERTLRYHYRRWIEDCYREREPRDDLVRACNARVPAPPHQRGHVKRHSW